MATIKYPVWLSDEKEYLNDVKVGEGSPDAIIDKIMQLWENARQGWAFVKTGNLTDGITIRANLKPTTNRAKELAKQSDDNDE